MTKQFIPESELIINPDGTVFHLHLSPSQLTDNIILVGDPGRVNMVAEFFDTIDYDVSSREFHTIGGTYKGRPIMCLSHGIGPDNIDIVINELDALANIDFRTREVKDTPRILTLVRIGTSGALQPELSLGTPVIAEKAIGFDGVLNYYAGRNEIADHDFEHAFCHHVKWNPLWAKPYVVDADAELVDRIAGDDMVRGNTISAVGLRASGTPPQTAARQPRPQRSDRVVRIQRTPCHKLRNGKRTPSGTFTSDGTQSHDSLLDYRQPFQHRRQSKLQIGHTRPRRHCSRTHLTTDGKDNKRSRRLPATRSAAFILENTFFLLSLPLFNSIRQ